MNEDIIFNMIRPYLKNNLLTYSEFESIFSMLNLREKYDVINILIKRGIDFSEELEVSNEEKDTEFKVLYDNLIFENKDSKKSDENSYLSKEKVNQSNRVLCKLIQEGNSVVRQDLCIKNKGLVEKVAHKYYKAFGNDLDFEDLVQVGMEGLLIAAEKYDTYRENEFSTYAMWWIRQFILREIYNKGFRIRIPVHMMELVGKIEKINDDLIYEGYNFNDRLIEIGRRLNISNEKIIQCISIRKYFLSTKSLNTPIGDDEDTELQELIMEEKKSVEDIVVEKDIFRRLRKQIESLTPREEKIISLRYGLDDGRDRTLEEVGKEFNLTRERIRQIESKVLKKMRHTIKSRELK
ncbi:MAG: sigma-70 family RNA polymerase sigma factor [Clostridium beijerinckii]|jgi:RNA polymerase primary sigma factor|nr:sigma-70 family RNA polymerase sigma factor [Clostridium beijerinckii]MCI1583479.1 sigma-70 family RNA polymerase sigma factor [Clostridium beijerinckii]MCI1623685.1 sigma-70 family RNA polymerase sigma factor [Clostridium beijerinckii]